MEQPLYVAVCDIAGEIAEIVELLGDAHTLASSPSLYRSRLASLGERIATASTHCEAKYLVDMRSNYTMAKAAESYPRTTAACTCPACG